jgi:hypothetical protein
MKRWLAALALVLAGGAFAAEDAALRVVEACQARLDPVADIGIERIQRRCPELLPALDHARWRGLLPQHLRERREDLSAASLRALAELVRHANDGAPRGAQPVLPRLAPVLAELGDTGQQGATRWERFKRWLKESFEDRKKDDEQSPLEQWSHQFRTSEGVARAFTYLGYAMVMALVLFVIWSELKAAGLFGAARRAARRANPAAEWRRRLMLADVMAAPLAERPGMLLRLLGEALTRAHRLPAAEGMTAGAIARRAELEGEADRAALAQLAVTSDEIRYADRRPPDSALENTVSAARALLAKFARLPGKR